MYMYTCMSSIHSSYLFHSIISIVKKKKKKLLNRLLKTFWKVMVFSYPEYAGISYVRRQRLEQIADIRYA